MKFDIFEITAGVRLFNGVGGTFLFDRQSLRLQSGRAALLPTLPPKKKTSRSDEFITRAEPPRSQAAAEGAIAFDPAAPQPYQVSAKATFAPIDAALLAAGSPAETSPVIEGEFAATGSLAGSGINRDDLLARSRGDLRFTGHKGIVRLLRASVAEALSIDATPASEAWERLGSAVGAILGVQGGVTSGKVNVSKPAEAVLNFTYRTKEFVYDEMTVTACRAEDGAIEVEQFDIRAPQLHLSGSGKIAAVAGVPLGMRPLSLELQLGAQGAMAQILTTAALLSAETDAVGYSRLQQPLHFGGTLQKVDATQWQELLAEAARRAPPKTKK